MTRDRRWLSHPADRRTLAWSLSFFPALPILGFARPGWAPWLVPLALYAGFCAGVLTHYHNHRAVFRSRALSRAYSVWLSVFYGFPIWSWIPTHNQNHHKYLNGPEDATSTFRRGLPDTLWEALSYPTRSSSWQAPALVRYLSARRAERSPRFYEALAQTLAVPLVHAGALAAFVAAHGFAGALAYLCVLGLPALFAPWSMMFINYLQHVGCDPDSPDDHSRNFVGSWENWLVFDAGLHTVHHEEPGAHWSEYRALHAARSPRIAPILNQRNVLTFLVRRYLLGEREHLLRESLKEQPQARQDRALGFSGEFS